jgi:hypothetical protein
VGLLSEGSVQGLDRLNELRAGLGVERLEKVWHSCYLDEREIELVFGSVEVVHFAPLYWLHDPRGVSVFRGAAPQHSAARVRSRPCPRPGTSRR